MKLSSRVAIVLVIAWTTHTFFLDVNCRSLAWTALTDPEMDVEYFTVHQHTKLFRRKRDALNHVDFPPFMDFNLRFDAKQLNLRLKRNEFMTSKIQLSDGNGPIKHDLSRKTGIYSDLETRASFIVQCADHNEHCVLRGSMMKEGRLWDILPEPHTPKLHKAIQRNNGVDINFWKDGVLPPTTNLTPDEEKKENKDSLPRRQKREIPLACELVENYAIADETVWTFHLEYAGNDVATAEENLVAEYLALYTQADLHYGMVSFRRPGTCIRLYLVGVHIQKTRAESWSVPNELPVGEADPPFVSALTGMVTCGTHGNELRSESTSIDLIQCFTRKDLAYDPDDNGTFYAFHRSLSFLFTVCDPEFLAFTSGVSEQYGDKVELLLAHMIAHGLGASHDGSVGCSDSDQYIMAETLQIPVDDLKLRNIWYFSTCTLDDIFAHLDTQPKCLRSHGFSDDEYNNFANQTLAGRTYSWETQCVYRFGLTSVRCDPTGQNRTYFPDMCDRGIYCTNPQAADMCSSVTRPYDGTPCGDLNAYCSKGECINPPRGLGVVCTSFSECAGANTTCSSTTQTCECIDGFYADASSDCQPKVRLGSACSHADACSGANALCNSGVCTCQAGYYMYGDRDSCALLKYAGEPCESSDECFGNGFECLGYSDDEGHRLTCRCPSDRYLEFDGGNCVLKKNLTESCEPGQCGPEFSFCDLTTHTCEYQEGVFDDNDAATGGNCSEKVELNAFCQQMDECLDPNAECISMTCSCRHGFAEIHGICGPLKTVGERCTSDKHCRGRFMNCSGSPSTCRCPSDRYHDEWSGDCVLKAN